MMIILNKIFWAIQFLVKLPLLPFVAIWSIFTAYDFEDFIDQILETYNIN